MYIKKLNIKLSENNEKLLIHHLNYIISDYNVESIKSKNQSCVIA